MAADFAQAARQPPVDRLYDGIRVVFAGPPNSGKSSLINAMVGREVAIATSIPGTTRDRIEAPVTRDGVAWLLIDVAGLRESTDDTVEAIGIARAREAIAAADLVIWLGDDPSPDRAMIAIHARADAAGRSHGNGRLAVSATTGAGVSELWNELGRRARDLLPVMDETAFNVRQLACVADAAQALMYGGNDLILVAEHLRRARLAIDRVTGAQGHRSDARRLVCPILHRQMMFHVAHF